MVLLVVSDESRNYDKFFYSVRKRPTKWEINKKGGVDAIWEFT